MKYKDLQKEDKRLFNSFMRNKLNKANAPKIKGGVHRLMSIYRGFFNQNPIQDFYNQKESILKSLGQSTKTSLKTGYVYFIGSDDPDFKHIKIGYSKSPQDRLKQLQTSCPVKLRVLSQIEGNLSIESDIQRKFKGCRLEGEWFRRGASINNYLNSLYSNILL